MTNETKASSETLEATEKEPPERDSRKSDDSLHALIEGSVKKRPESFVFVNCSFTEDGGNSEKKKKKSFCCSK
jgi:hypothetical protein